MTLAAVPFATAIALHRAGQSAAARSVVAASAGDVPPAADDELESLLLPRVPDSSMAPTEAAAPPHADATRAELEGQVRMHPRDRDTRLRLGGAYRRSWMLGLHFLRCHEAFGLPLGEPRMPDIPRGRDEVAAALDAALTHLAAAISAHPQELDRNARGHTWIADLGLQAGAPELALVHARTALASGLAPERCWVILAESAAASPADGALTSLLQQAVEHLGDQIDRFRAERALARALAESGETADALLHYLQAATMPGMSGPHADPGNG